MANMLAPLLHLPGWREAVDATGCPTPLQQWAHAALVALPEVDGVPDAHAKMSLLDALCTAPDGMTAEGCLVLNATEGLRKQLVSFARVCRRLPPA